MLTKYYIHFSTVIMMYAAPNPQAGLHGENGTTFYVHYPKVTNIRESRVILINGYNLGISMLAILSFGTDGLPKYPQRDVRSGDFYTNVYRWALRAISLIPDWLAAGSSSTYPESQKVWRKRFYYMEDEVPQLLRKILFFVDDWDRQAWARTRYNVFAKPSFDKHLRFPSKGHGEKFDFASFNITKETVENVDDSVEVEPVAPRSMNFGQTLRYPW